MPSVPNWITTAYVYNPGADLPGELAVRTLNWRATPTQVVVDIMAARGRVERRFRLSDLREVSSRHPRPELRPADDPDVIEALTRSTVDGAARYFRDALDRQQIRSGMRAEDLAAALDAMRVAAAEALSRLKDAL